MTGLVESRLGQGWPRDLKLKKYSFHFQIVLTFSDCVISLFHPKAKRVKFDSCSHSTWMVFERKQRKDPYMSKVVKERGAQGSHAQQKVFESGEKRWTPFPTVQFRDWSACPLVTLGWDISSENAVEISSRWWEDYGQSGYWYVINQRPFK